MTKPGLLIARLLRRFFANFLPCFRAEMCRLFMELPRVVGFAQRKHSIRILKSVLYGPAFLDLAGPIDRGFSCLGGGGGKRPPPFLFSALLFSELAQFLGVLLQSALLLEPSRSEDRIRWHGRSDVLCQGAFRSVFLRERSLKFGIVVLPENFFE